MTVVVDVDVAEPDAVVPPEAGVSAGFLTRQLGVSPTTLRPRIAAMASAPRKGGKRAAGVHGVALQEQLTSTVRSADWS